MKEKRRRRRRSNSCGIIWNYAYPQISYHLSLISLACLPATHRPRPPPMYSEDVKSTWKFTAGWWQCLSRGKLTCRKLDNIILVQIGRPGRIFFYSSSSPATRVKRGELGFDCPNTNITNRSNNRNWIIRLGPSYDQTLICDCQST